MLPFVPRGSGGKPKAGSQIGAAGDGGASGLGGSIAEAIAAEQF